MLHNRLFQIEAASQHEADEIAKALHIIYVHVNRNDLVAIANAIQKEPGIINKVVRVSNNPLVRKLFKKS